MLKELFIENLKIKVETAFIELPLYMGVPAVLIDRFLDQYIVWSFNLIVAELAEEYELCADIRDKIGDAKKWTDNELKGYNNPAFHRQVLKQQVLEIDNIMNDERKKA